MLVIMLPLKSPNLITLTWNHSQVEMDKANCLMSFIASSLELGLGVFGDICQLK